MSVHKETKVRNLIQQRGLIHVGSAKTAATDIGIVGEYADSGTKYAGLFRDIDDGAWNLFDGLADTPFLTDAVSKNSGFHLSTLNLGQLNTNSLSNATINGDLAIGTTGTGKVVLTNAEVAAPTTTLGVANKSYVDGLVQGFVAKQSVVVKTTGTLTVTVTGSGVGKTISSAVNQSITDAAAYFDNVLLDIGDRVLVADQTAKQDNGIYVVTAGGNSDPVTGASWVLTRATDADNNPDGELTRGAHVFVDDGDINQNTGWVLQGPFDTFIIDDVTTGFQTWVKFSKDTPISVTGQNVGLGDNVYAGMSGSQLLFNTLKAAQVGGAATQFTLDTSSIANTLTFKFDQSKITGVGAITDGSIGVGFGGIATQSAISGASLATAGALSFQGATGENYIALPDNLDNALTFSEGANQYLRFITTNAGEKIQAFKPLETAAVAIGDTLSVSNLATLSGGASLNGELAFTNTVTGSNKITLMDNLADALSVQEGANKYLTFSTSDAAEKITVHKAMDVEVVTDTPNSVVNQSTLWNMVHKDAVYGQTVVNLNVTVAGSGPTKTLTNNVNGVISNFTSSFDGVTIIVGTRVLVNFQTIGGDNGIYRLVDLGSAGTPWVLQRAPDLSTTAQLAWGLTVDVIFGFKYGGATYYLPRGGLVMESSDLTFQISNHYLHNQSFSSNSIVTLVGNSLSSLRIADSSNGTLLSYNTTATAPTIVVSALTELQVLKPVTRTSATTAAITRDYLDTNSFKSSCVAATVGNLTVVTAPAVGINTKTLTNTTVGLLSASAALFDGVTLVLGDRVLVRAQTAAEDNGIYYVSTEGTASTAWVLKRDVDANSAVKLVGSYTFVSLGGVYACTVWTVPAITIFDTTAITFMQIAVGSQLTASAGQIANMYKQTTTGTLQFRAIEALVGANTTSALELVESAGKVSLSFDQSKITSMGALTSGSISTGFGTIATSNPISGSTLGTASTLTFTGAADTNQIVVPDNLDYALDIVSTDGLSYMRVATTDGAEQVEFDHDAVFNSNIVAGGVIEAGGELAFTNTNTGSNKITLMDNLADALSVQEGANKYLTFSTSDAAEKITVHKAMDVEVVTDTPNSVVNQSTLWGYTYKDSVYCQTVVDLAITANGSGPTKTLTNNSNGVIGNFASSFDNINITVLGTRILVNSQADGRNNGIYQVVDLGSASTPWVLQRTHDLNTAEQFTHGVKVDVIAGTVYSGITFYLPSGDMILETYYIEFLISPLMSNKLVFTNTSQILIPNNDALSIGSTSGQLVSYNTTTGALSVIFGSNTEVRVPKPVTRTSTATSAISRDYLDTKSFKSSCMAATAVNLIVNVAGSGVTKTLTNNTVGLLSASAALFDGVTLVLGDRVLVRAQTVAQNNGIYYVSTAGTASAAWVLTRDIDANSTVKLAGSYTFVSLGTVYANTVWTVQSTAILESTAITFMQIAVGSQLTASAGQIANIYKQNAAGTLQFRAIEALVGTNTTSALALTEAVGKVSLSFDQSKITGIGALTSGSISTGFGTIATSNPISGSTLGTASTLTFTGASGVNKLTAPDNLADAFDIVSTDGLSYFRAVTTNTDEHVEFDQRSVFKSDTQVRGLVLGVTNVSADTTLTSQHNIVNVTAASTVTLTLPDATTNAGRTYKIAKIDSGAGFVVIVPSGSDVIDGDVSAVSLVAQYDYTRVTCHGASGWYMH